MGERKRDRSFGIHRGEKPWRALFLGILVAISCIPAVSGIPPLPAVINLTGGATPAPVSLAITAHPAQAHIGDTIILNGTVSGINTIAVYLYLTAPGLDPRGVALENLNIAAGRGLFTTAPVKMGDGTWTYVWDTSIIIGTMEPGTYTVHVVASPLDRFRSQPQESATAEIDFQPPQKSSTRSPLPAAVPALALLVAGALFAAGMRRT